MCAGQGAGFYLTKEGGTNFDVRPTRDTSGTKQPGVLHLVPGARDALAHRGDADVGIPETGSLSGERAEPCAERMQHALPRALSQGHQFTAASTWFSAHAQP